jgi:hypothetical protein
MLAVRGEIRLRLPVATQLAGGPTAPNLLLAGRAARASCNGSAAPPPSSMLLPPPLPPAVSSGKAAGKAKAVAFEQGGEHMNAQITDTEAVTSTQ